MRFHGKKGWKRFDEFTKRCCLTRKKKNSELYSFHLVTLFNTFLIHCLKLKSGKGMSNEENLILKLFYITTYLIKIGRMSLKSNKKFREITKEAYFENSSFYVPLNFGVLGCT